MKNVFVLTAIFLSISTFAQKAEIFEENGSFGLKTDFGKELLPADYTEIIRYSTDTLDFFLAHLVGSSELYSYSQEKRDIYDEVGRLPFTEIKYEWNESIKANQFYGYTKLGERYQFLGQSWEKIKVKHMIGCKDKSGKYAVCIGGEAISGYDYLEVDAKHKELVVVRTDSGWIALDTKMKSHYDWSFDKIHNSEIHPEAFIIEKDSKWGILSLDGSMNLPPSEMKNPQQMFDFDGESYAELERAYAVKRGGKWGIVNEENDELADFRYDNAYMVDDFAIEQHELEVHAVVKDGGTWKFLDSKWKEHKSAQFDTWIGVHGNVALVVQGGKVVELDLKSFEIVNELYFADYDDFQIVQSEDEIYGVVGKKGDILMPFEFKWIAQEGDDEEEFFVAEKGEKDGIYSLEGKNLVAHEYDDLVFLEKKNGKNYFSVGKVGEAALAYWDAETNKMVLLTKKMYLNISYHYGDKKFTCATLDGVYHNLDDEGKMVQDH
jgi:hypothetical protein